MNGRHALLLLCALPLMILALACWMLAFVLVLPTWAKESDLPGELPVRVCQARIATEVERASTGGIHLDESGPDPAWSLTGIAGERRTLRWRGAVFHLARVYFPGEDTQKPNAVWAVLWMRTQDGKMISAVQGLSPWQIEKLFQPGNLRVRLTASGPYVTRLGIDCMDWQERFSQAGFPFCAIEEMQVVSTSQTLIENGFAPSDPLNGFIFWQIYPQERLSLCETEPVQQRRPR